MMNRYVVISPVRDEERDLPRTIAAMLGQSHRPEAWMIVDDGSSDRTAEIAEAAAVSNPWIHVRRLRDRGARSAGTGVMEAFSEGYASLPPELAWDFVVKLDGDLSFGPDCFARSLAEFEGEPRLGIGGGMICVPQQGDLAPEYEDPPFHVRGPCKIYRRACWHQLGGLLHAPGWDTFDLIKAQSLGWRTKTFPHIRLIHLRPTGRAYGTWANWVKNGLANYVVGYHPLFMAVKCLRRVASRPYVVAAGGLMTGFVKGYWRRVPQVRDAGAIRYLRQQQLNYLTGRGSLWRRREDSP